MTDPPDLDQYAATVAPTVGRRRTGAPAPPWTPRLELDDAAGVLTTGVVDGDPDWPTIFAHWNLDPALWDVVPGTLRVNAWEGPAADGPTIFRQYRANVVRRTRPGVDVDDQLRAVARWRRGRTVAPVADPHAWVVACADWQVGGRPSSTEFVERFTSTLAGLVDHGRRAVRDGARHLVVAFLGDMVEGVGGNYPAQPFEVDLTARDQVRVVRHCETALLRAIVPLGFTSTTVVAVAGNHGRGGPKVTTTVEDSLDLMAAEGVAEVLTESGAAARYGIEFVIPTDAAVALVDAAGTQLLVAHGDQVAGSADRLRSWWAQTAFTRWGDADCADVLLTGHRHHLRVEELAVGRWLMVAPTLGGESRWYAEQGGGTSLPGTLTFSTRDRRWWGMEVVRPTEPQEVPRVPVRP